MPRIRAAMSLRLGVALIGGALISGCATQGPGVPPPPTAQPPAPAEREAVVSGAAMLAGAGYAPLIPGSVLTVRVYDSLRGDVNAPLAEERFSETPAALPWMYEMRVSLGALEALGAPAVAARIEGPDGRLLYRNDAVVPLREGVRDDIPVVPVTAPPYQGAPTPPGVL